MGLALRAVDDEAAHRADVDDRARAGRQHVASGRPRAPEAPLRFTSSTLSQRSSSIASAAISLRAMPALLIRISIRPSRATTWTTTRSAAPDWVTSSTAVAVSKPFAASAWRACSSSPGVEIAQSHPCACLRQRLRRRQPDSPRRPVTSTARPSSLNRSRYMDQPPMAVDAGHFDEPVCYWGADTPSAFFPSRRTGSRLPFRAGTSPPAGRARAR